MSANYTALNSFTTPVTTWADGDLNAAAGINAGWQSLADQRYYLQQIATVTGATLIQSGTTVNMQAVTSPASGSAFYVTGQGVYNWTPGDTSTVDGYSIVAAGAGQPAGRWKHFRSAVFNANPGPLGIGVGGAAAGRIPATVVPNGFITSALSTLGADTTPASNTDVLSASVSAIAGDLLIYDAHCFLFNNFASGSPNVFAKLKVTDGGVTSNIANSVISAQGTNFDFVSASTTGKYTVGTTGTVTITMNAGSPNAEVIKAGTTIRLRLMRP